MSSVTCISCLRTVTKSESRLIEDGENKIIGRTCQSCRNETTRLRCSAVKRKTPHYKIKYLKSVPQSVGDLLKKEILFLQYEFGSVALSGNLRCCAACYIRLHRLSCNNENSTLVIVQPSPGGCSGITMTGGERIFLGQKSSTPVFIWVEDTFFFFWSEKSAHTFLGSNFRQANSSYSIQAKVPARSKSIISSLVFFWVQNTRLRLTPRHVYTRVTPPPPPRAAFTTKHFCQKFSWTTSITF